MKRCLVCNAENPAPAPTCVDCGNADFAPAAPPPREPEGATTPPTPPRRGTR